MDLVPRSLQAFRFWLPCFLGRRSQRPHRRRKRVADHPRDAQIRTEADAGRDGFVLRQFRTRPQRNEIPQASLLVRFSGAKLQPQLLNRKHIDADADWRNLKLARPPG